MTGYGSSATGHPSGATAGDVPGREVPVPPEDRARGVTEEHIVSTVQGAPAAREARGLGTGAGVSEMFARHGSGSTTNVPGGTPGSAPGTGDVGGPFASGVGGPGAPTDSPIAESGVRGAGARSERTDKGETNTATDEGREMTKGARKRP